MSDEMVKIDVPALGVQVQYQVDQGPLLSFQTHLDGTCDQRDIDEVLERCHKSVRRLQAVIELPRALENLAALERGAEGQRNMLRAIEEEVATKQRPGRQGDPKISVQDQQKIDQQRALVEQLPMDILMVRHEVEKLKARIEYRDPPPPIDPPAFPAGVLKRIAQRPRAA